MFVECPFLKKKAILAYGAEITPTHEAFSQKEGVEKPLEAFKWRLSLYAPPAGHLALVKTFQQQLVYFFLSDLLTRAHPRGTGGLVTLVPPPSAS